MPARFVRAASAAACVALLALAACSSSPPRVRLGEIRSEVGDGRACGRAARPLDRGGAKASADRRAVAVRDTLDRMACAAREARDVELLEAAEGADGDPLPTAGDASGAAQCYDGFRATGDPRADLDALAEACARAIGMRPLTRVVEGTAAEAGAPTVFAIDLDATRCYRVFAVADAGVGVLATAIADEEGNLVAVDNSRDRAPILGPRAPFCPMRGGRFRLVVHAARGEGRYVVQGWSRARAPR